jgi:hypothetical protein
MYDDDTLQEEKMSDPELEDDVPVVPDEGEEDDMM